MNRELEQKLREGISLLLLNDLITYDEAISILVRLRKLIDRTGEK